MKALQALPRSRRFWALFMSAVLAGCNGGDNPVSISTGISGTLAGTAATGAGISGGTVTVKCAAGPDPAPATTNASGAWSVSVSGITLPCKVKVSGGNLPSGTAFHSIAVDLGTINITPMTDLVVANLSGQDPAAWYAGVTATDLSKISASAVRTAVGNVRTAINVAAFGNSVDPITTTLVIGDAIDRILDALKVAAPNYATLLAAAQSQGFASTFANTYAAALNTALSGQTNGGGNNGGGSVVVQPSGNGYTIAYSAAAGIGIDLRDPVSATFNPTTGGLEGYSYSVNEAPTLGQMTSTDIAGDGVLTIGRWSNGFSGGVWYPNTPFQGKFYINEKDGFHYAIGKATSTLPTSGVVTYNISKSTPLTYKNLGSFPLTPSLSGSVTIDFTSKKVGISLNGSRTATVNGLVQTYAIKTTGELANLSMSEVSFDTGANFRGFGNTVSTVGGATLGTYIAGFVAGPSADRIALVIRIDEPSGVNWYSTAAILTKPGAAGGGGASNPLLTAANCSSGINTGFSLVAEVSVAGIASVPVCVDGLSSKPATQAEFCGNTQFQQGLPPGVTINTCSYNPSTGVADVTATLSVAPGVPGVAYSVKYTFISR